MDSKLFFIFYNFGKTHKKIYFISKKNSMISKIIFVLLFVFDILFLSLTKNTTLVSYILVPLIVLATVNFLRYVVKRKRPFEKFNLPIDFEKNSFSFPSNHTASSLIISLMHFYILGKFSILFLCYSVLTGVSRVIIGVHYPSDILASFFISTLIFFIFIYF